MTNHVSFLLPRNNYIYEEFNRITVQLVEAGIMQRYVTENADDYKEPDDDSGPIALTLDHLGIGFEICFLFLVIAFAVFLCEFVCVRLARWPNVHISLHDAEQKATPTRPIHASTDQRGQTLKAIAIHMIEPNSIAVSPRATKGNATKAASLISLPARQNVNRGRNGRQGRAIIPCPDRVRSSATTELHERFRNAKPPDKFQ